MLGGVFGDEASHRLRDGQQHGAPDSVTLPRTRQALDRKVSNRGVSREPALVFHERTFSDRNKRQGRHTGSPRLGASWTVEALRGVAWAWPGVARATAR